MKLFLILFLICLLSVNCFAAMHENQWMPDTSDAIIVYQWDDSLPADQRVHTVKEIIRHDKNHPNMTMEQEYAAILEENQRKNKVYGQLLGISALSQTITNPDGSSSIILKNGITVNFSYTGTDPNRILVISVSGYMLSLQQKSVIQNWCDNNLGIGKVQIN